MIHKIDLRDILISPHWPPFGKPMKSELCSDLNRGELKRREAKRIRTSWQVELRGARGARERHFRSVFNTEGTETTEVGVRSFLTTDYTENTDIIPLRVVFGIPDTPVSPAVKTDRPLKAFSLCGYDPLARGEGNSSPGNGPPSAHRKPWHRPHAEADRLKVGRSLSALGTSKLGLR
jgi:hypothetical protein